MSNLDEQILVSIISALRRIKDEKGEKYLFPENSKKFRSLLNDYLADNKYKSFRTILFNLCKDGSLKNVNLRGRKGIRDLLNANEGVGPVAIKGKLTECPNCHRNNKPNANYCSNCGHKLKNSDLNRCNNCGAAIEEGEKFCSECGHEIKEDSSKVEFEKISLDELIVLEKETHNPEVQEILGDRSYEKKNVQKAFSWYRKAAVHGRATAQCKLANIYREESKWRSAFDWYMKAAKQNNPEAMYCIGALYFCGDGVRKDKKKAFEWTIKAAKLGHCMAQCHIADFYFSGINNEVNYDKAFVWLKKSVKENSNFGKPFYLLGECYLHGYGTKCDSKKAFNYYKKAVEKNYIPGIIKLAECYYDGEQCEMDREKAFSLLYSIKDSERITAEALYILGKMLFDGDGCSENEEEGWGYIKRAADRNYWDAKNFIDEHLEGEDLDWEDGLTRKIGDISSIIIVCSNWSLKNGSLKLKVKVIKNLCYWDTGALKIIFWYSDKEYWGGRLHGEEMGEYVFSPDGLDPYEVMEDMIFSFECEKSPWRGDKHHIVTINELHEDGEWYIVDYYNFGVTNWD